MKRIVWGGLGGLLLVSGCFLEGGLGKGKTADVEIKASSPLLEEVLSDPESLLLAAGVPVEGSFRCVELKLRSGDMTVIEVRGTGRLDPVAAVVDKQGNLLAANDDWEQYPDCRLVLSRIPSGSRLLVWGMNGKEGRVQVSLSAGTSEDLLEWTARATLETGVMYSRLRDDKGDHGLQDLVSGLQAQDIYPDLWDNARLVPFTVTQQGYHLLGVESDDFDGYLVLLSLDRGAARYLAADDDGGSGLNPMMVQELEPGTYAALVNSYNGRDGGRFTLSVSPLEAGGGRIHEVAVPGTAEADLDAGQIALMFWPGIAEEWHISSLSAATPVTAFRFQVEEPGVYLLTARSPDTDATMTLLEAQDPERPVCIDYNDDFEGLDPGLLLDLSPGAYLALVSAYDGGPEGNIVFSVVWDESLQPEPVLLTADRPYSLRMDRMTPYGLFLLDITGGYSYGIAAVSAELDPVITLTFPDGSELSDDDGGEGSNSLLEFVPTADQLGEALLRVENYWGSAEGVITVTFMRLGRLTEQQTFSLYD